MDNVLLNIFFVYSREDSILRERLDKHLSGLKRRNFINTWYDGKINPGKEWEEELNFNLSKSDIILLLISADFIASDYCYEIEMKKAIQRHENGEAIIIPVLLTPCDWSELPFAKIQALPQNGKPITSPTWPNQEVALNEIANAIKETVDNLRLLKSGHLKSINEVLKEKDAKLKITLEQLEELALEQLIKDETIESQRKNINELESKIANLNTAIIELKRTFDGNNEHYEKMIKHQQIELNRIKTDKEKIMATIEKLCTEIIKLETKKNNIEENIERMKK